MLNVDSIFDKLTPDELEHVDSGRPAAFAWSLVTGWGLTPTAVTIASLNEVYAEIRRRLGYAE